MADDQQQEEQGTKREYSTEELRALGSAEANMWTYIVDGKAMSLEEMRAYRVQKAKEEEEAIQAAAAFDAAEDEKRRVRREEDAAKGIHY